MPRSARSSFFRFLSQQAFSRPQALVSAFLATALFGTAATAQDWGEAPNDSWEAPRDEWESPRDSRTYDAYPPAAESGFDRGDIAETGWSARAGLGFTADPSSLLLNFDFPFSFDRYVAVGPMLQVGIDEDETIIAPTIDLTLKVPDVGIVGLERVQPYGFVGIGFAVIEDDDRANDNSATDFLIHFGVGIEYQVSDRLFLGSHMTFNFLPAEALGQTFFYSWQVGGARIAF